MGKAIVAIKDRRGCSRSAIARWIQINCEKSSGSTFNAALRSAIKKGLESGLFKEGNSKQRFRIGVLPKAPKKKVASKKKKTNSKKKVSKKKSSKKESRLKEENCIQEEEDWLEEEKFFQEESWIKEEGGNKEKGGDEEEKLVKEEVKQ